MDETGLIEIDHHPTTQPSTLKLANGASYTIPVAVQYRGNANNRALANGGFHYHEDKSGTTASAVDRAQHRADFNEQRPRPLPLKVRSYQVAEAARRVQARRRHPAVATLRRRWCVVR
jgi:hypothetical protein